MLENGDFETEWVIVNMYASNFNHGYDKFEIAL